MLIAKIWVSLLIAATLAVGGAGLIARLQQLEAPKPVSFWRSHPAARTAMQAYCAEHPGDYGNQNCWNSAAASSSLGGN